MSRAYLTLLIMLFICGCSTVHWSERQAALVNYEDGINKKEAKRIAIDHFLLNNQSKNDLNVVFVSTDKSNAGIWRAKFISWKLFKTSIVHVDKRSGEIVE